MVNPAEFVAGLIFSTLVALQICALVIGGVQFLVWLVRQRFSLATLLGVTLAAAALFATARVIPWVVLFVALPMFLAVTLVMYAAGMIWMIEAAIGNRSGRPCNRESSNQENPSPEPDSSVKS